MNKKTRALSKEDFTKIMTAIEDGFIYTDEDTGKTKRFRANGRLAMILRFEAVSGLRIGDILQLHLEDIVKDGRRYRFDVVEQKTGKPRTFTVSNTVYMVLKNYAYDNGIKPDEILFRQNNGKPLTVRAIEKQLAIVTKYLGLEDISTHSFRKSFATTAYENNGYNIELVRQLLQHSSVTTTQRYIGISSKQVEDALTDVANTFMTA